MTKEKRMNSHCESSRKRRKKNFLDYVSLIRKSSTNQANVSLNIAKHLFEKQPNKNIVFSPLSLQVILSIIAAGSDGPTQQQLLDFLQFESIDHLNSFASQLVSVILKDAASAGGPRLSFVNGVWIEKTLSIQPSFKQIVSSNYKVTLASVDFLTKANEVTKEVNLWAEEETNGLIKEILPQGSVDNFTRLIFANALYFKGKWNQKFDALTTKPYDFHLLNGNSIKVPFMTSKKKQHISAFNDFKVLRLPYEQGEDKRQISMYIFLPNEKHGLPALVKKLASKFELLQDKLPFQQVKVGEFRIPRFEVSYGLETSHMLKELGVTLPFSHGAGLAKMVDSPAPADQDLLVSKIFQKSFIEVNEEGTEAAAVNALITKKRMGKSMCIPTRLDFVADHPFLFLIREDLTGTILFMGQVHNPLAGRS